MLFCCGVAAIFGYCCWDCSSPASDPDLAAAGFRAVPTIGDHLLHAVMASGITFVVLLVLMTVIALIWLAFLNCLRGISSAVRGDE